MMAAHYLTRPGLGYCFLLCARQTVQVNGHGAYCKQSYGEFKIQNSRFQKLTFQHLKAHFENLKSGILSLNLPFIRRHLEILGLESWVWNLESALTTHRSPKDRRTYLAFELDPLYRLRESLPPPAGVCRCNETFAPVNKLPSSGAPELRRALPRAAAGDSPAGVHDVRYQSKRRPNRKADRRLYIQRQSVRQPSMRRSDGSTTCNCSSRAECCNPHRLKARHRLFRA